MVRTTSKRWHSSATFVTSFFALLVVLADCAQAQYPPTSPPEVLDSSVLEMEIHLPTYSGLRDLYVHNLLEHIDASASEITRLIGELLNLIRVSITSDPPCDQIAKVLKQIKKHSREIETGLRTCTTYCLQPDGSYSLFVMDQITLIADTLNRTIVDLERYQIYLSVICPHLSQQLQETIDYLYATMSIASQITFVPTGSSDATGEVGAGPVDVLF